MIIDSITFSRETRSERVTVSLIPEENLLFLARVAIMPMDRMIEVAKLGRMVTLQSRDPEFIDHVRAADSDLLGLIFGIDVITDPNVIYAITVPNVTANLSHIGGINDPRLIGVASIVDGTFQEISLNEASVNASLNN